MLQPVKRTFTVTFK